MIFPLTLGSPSAPGNKPATTDLVPGPSLLLAELATWRVWMCELTALPEYSQVAFPLERIIGSRLQLHS